MVATGRVRVLAAPRSRPLDAGDAKRSALVHVAQLVYVPNRNRLPA